MSLTPTQRLQARSMGMTVDWAEDLLSFIGIRPDLATFPMEYYTPEGANLSDANFEQALESAIAAAQDGNGGIIQIPAGSWSPGDMSILVASAGRDKPVYIEGAGVDCTNLVLPVGYTGTVFHLSGIPGDGAADLYYNGGIGNLSISCAADDVSNAGTAIKISSCIGSQFRNLALRSFTGGNGFQSTFTAPDFTNQYCQLWNVTSGSNDVNFRLTSFVNSQGYGVYSIGAITNDLLCDDVKAAFFGGNMQSSPTNCVRFAGNGGCQVVFHDFYYEGTANTIFKLESPAVSSNQVAIYNFHLGGSPAIFANTDAFNDLMLNSVNLIGNATVILKARNGAISTLIGAGDPVGLPLKYDLDAASAAVTTCLGGGAFFGTLQRFVKVVSPPSAGPVIYVHTDGSLRFRGAGGTVTTLAPT